MGDPRNPSRQRDEWDPSRLKEMEDEITKLPEYVVFSGGWAWHFMSPPHREYKILHDHKDVDLFVPPVFVGSLIATLKARGYQRVWTRFDGVSDNFTRYEKHTEGGVKILLDVFVDSIPFVIVKGVRVVDPTALLPLYGEIHETEDCVAVLAAKNLLEKRFPVVGSEDLVKVPWEE